MLDFLGVAEFVISARQLWGLRLLVKKHPKNRRNRLTNSNKDLESNNYDFKR